MFKMLCIAGFLGGLVVSIATYTANYFGLDLNPTNLFTQGDK